MTAIHFDPHLFLFVFPVAFGLFGFIKKAFKKVKNIVGGALSIVPGGSIIKQGLNVARDGFGAIVRAVSPPRQSQQPGTNRPAPFQQSQFRLPSTDKIFGIDKSVVFAIGGVALILLIVFRAKLK